MTTFHELPGPSVFIASPGDLTDLREYTSSILTRLLEESASRIGLTTYDWKKETCEEGFVDWLPAQEQIPIPYGPHCRGVICMFGERIGSPIIPDVSLNELAHYLGNHSSPRADSAFRLVHPWPTRAEDVEETIASGGFPLTGTVFECLVALNANRSSMDREGNPPVLLMFIGDPERSTRTDIEMRGMGHRKFLTKVRTYFDENSEQLQESPEDALYRWKREEYVPQLRQLQNFLGYLAAKENLFDLVVREPDARIKIEHFLRKWVIKTPDDIDDVALIKGLEAYGEKDFDRFFGRLSDQELAVAVVERTWGDLKPNFFGITGPSGVGKSSFLRAGLIGHLQHAKPHIYYGFAVRPVDLAVASRLEGSISSPVSKLFDQAIGHLLEAESKRKTSEVRTRINEELQNRTKLANLRADLQPLEAVDRLQKIIGPGRRLLIGLDQFEEMVDQIQSPEKRVEWQTLIDFIAASVASESIGIAYTLQLNRAEALSCDRDLGRFFAIERLRNLDFIWDASLEQMIGGVFQRARIELEPQLATELVGKIKKFAGKAGREDSASLTPLVSLTLKRIYETVVLPVRPVKLDSPLPATRAGMGEAVSELAVVGDGSTAVPLTFAEASSEGPPQSGAGLRENSARPVSTDATVPIYRPRDVLLVLANSEQASVDAGPAPPTEGTLRLGVPRELLEVEGAIAAQADAAVAKAQKFAGPAMSEDTLGSLLDRFVHRSVEKRFHLPPAPLPADWGRLRLALEFIDARLLIPHRDRKDFAYLVHEAVIVNWDAAKVWLRDREGLLKLEEFLLFAARQWHEDDKPVEQLSAYNADRAAELLIRRWEALSSSEVDRDLTILMAFTHSLLQAFPNPTRIIPNTKDSALQIEAAVLTRDANLVRLYLESNRSAATAHNGRRRTPLFSATSADSAEIIELLRENGCDPGEVDIDGWQPIHLAAYNGCAAALRTLLKYVSPTATGGPGKVTSLHLAAMNGQLEIAEAILADTRSDPNAEDDWKWTPLHYAVERGNERMVELLMDRKALNDREPSSTATPLYLAAQNGLASMVRLLIERGARRTARLNGYAPLDIAAVHGHAEVVVVLLDGADPKEVDARIPKSEKSALHLAAEKGHASVVEALLAGRVKLAINAKDAEGRTALHTAAENGHAEVVRTLLSRDADVDSRTKDARTALHLASENGFVEVVRALKSSAKIDLLDSRGRWPLRSALATGQEEVARVLVAELGASVDIPRHQGWTLLHLAALGGQERQVRTLLQLGADVNAAGPEDSTPLHLAAETGRDEIVSLLLEHDDTDVNAREIDRATPLHIAAERGHASVVAMLLRHSGIATEAVDSRGWTPFHRAARAGHSQVVQLLVDAEVNVGAPKNPDDPTQRPRTPLQMAAEVGSADVVALLLASGEDASKPCGPASPLVLALRNAQYPVAQLLLAAGAELTMDSEAERRSLVEAIVANMMLRERVGLPPQPAEVDVLSSLEAAGVELPFSMPREEGAREPAADGTDKPPQRGLLAYAWAVADPDVRNLILKQSPIDQGLSVRPEDTRIVTTTLPWYRDVLLIRVTDQLWPIEGLAIHYLLLDNDLYRLDGRSPPIHEVNAKAPVRLSEDNILDYLWFFNFFVRGQEGPFYLAERADDPILPVPRDHPTETVLQNTIRRATYEGLDGDGDYICYGTILYSRAIFDVAFRIQHSGMVTMLEDIPIAESLSIQIQAPIAYASTSGN